MKTAATLAGVNSGQIVEYIGYLLFTNRWMICKAKSDALEGGAV